MIPRHSNGGSKEGVSQAAVQAFLAKREMEKKKKAGRNANWYWLLKVHRVTGNKTIKYLRGIWGVRVRINYKETMFHHWGAGYTQSYFL